MSLTTYPDVEQGTEEWADLRRGMVTASAVGKLVTLVAPSALTVGCPTCQATADNPCTSVARKQPTTIKVPHADRCAVAASRPPVLEVADNDTSRALALTLGAERVAGFTEDIPMTSDMWRGRDAEPFARDIYSGYYQHAVEVGFMVRDDWGFELGYSPDGLVADDGLIEIKSPRAKTHLATILADEVPAHYMAQCQAGLLVSGRKWCDFISYVGGMPLFVKRVLPDPDWQAVIVAACQRIEDDIAAMVADYRSKTKTLPKTERIDLNALGLEF